MSIHKKEKVKTWVINLSKDKERKEYMENVLKDTGLDYSFFPAVYGNDLTFSRTERHIIAEKDGNVFVNPISSKIIELKNGEIGASISHRLLYKQLIDDKEYDKYLIFEDDIVIKDVEKLKKYLEQLPPSTEYDLARFEISRNYVKYRDKSLNDYYSTYENLPHSFKIGAFGYVITKRGAINILKKYGFTLLGAPDDFLNFFFHDGAVCIEPYELLIEARADIPSTIWGDKDNSKSIDKTHVNRVVVFGGTGMLGRYMVKFFSKKYNVVEVNRDVFDIGKKSVDEMVKYLDFIEKDDLVLNCAGVINKRPELSESEMIKVNSVFPYVLSQVVAEKMAWMVQPTTDCVFSGSKGCYTSSDWKDDRDVYGITKSIGETVIESRCSVIRCSIIGEERDNKRSLIEWAKSQKGNKVRGYKNHKWNGITCLQYAKEIDNMIGNGFPKRIHLRSFWIDNEGKKCDYITKYDLLCLVNRIYELGLEVEAYNTPISVYRNLEGTEVCVSLEDQIREMRSFVL